jgi:peptide/nickel transport system permease protein
MHQRVGSNHTSIMEMTYDPEDLKKYKKTSMLKEVWRSLRKNRLGMIGMFILIGMVFIAIFADYLSPYNFAEQNLVDKFLSPSWQHLFGTDNFGRDIFSRVIYGSRPSLAIGLMASMVSAFAGTILGAISGFYGEKVDNIIMRSIDVVMSIPSMLLAMSVVAALGTGFRNLIIAISIGAIPAYARIVRATILSLKGQEFIEAARCVGASDFRVVIRHLLPNCIPPIIVQMTIGAARAIQEAAALSFIGLGIMPPDPEWGAMLAASRSYIRDYWFMVTFPGVALMIAVFGLNLFGDGLRDALDPKLKT